jgi:hypothetical protein
MTRTKLNLESSGTMLFDGIAAACWEIYMTSDVTTPPRVRNIIPGVLYTFIFVQDAEGNTFAWPAACQNATPVNTAPLSTSVQNFIGLLGNQMAADLPGTWT